MLVLEMVTGRAARGPGRAGPGLSGPRAVTGRNGPKDFSFNCFLCIVRGQVSTRTVVQNCYFCIEQMIVNRIIQFCDCDLWSHCDKIVHSGCQRVIKTKLTLL